MVVGIVGSRHFGDYATFEAALSVYLPSETGIIVSGGAPGIDTLAEQFARRQNLPLHVFRTSLERGDFNAQAHARNQKIADAVDLLIVFPCEHSKGTYDTKRRAEKRGVRIIEHRVKCKA